MKKLFLIILTVNFFCLTAIAQPSISGRVVEANSVKPVAAASVFISHSSIGASTDNNGNFILKKYPEGKFTLVVSCIGYETFVKEFRAEKNGLNITIELIRKSADLGEVVVTPQEKNGWINWGDIFIEYFIGTSSYARGCKIKNPEVLKFKRNNKDSSLSVTAGEPIVIENKLLGYTIKYELKSFNYSFSNNTVRYSGYPLFEEMAANEKAQAKYNEARTKVYAVSLMHFIRSLYNETTEPDGFKVTRKINNATVEVKKNGINVQQAYTGVEEYDTIYEISNTKTEIKIIATENETAQKNKSVVTDKSSLASILTHDNANTVLNFTDTLQVVYSKANVPFEYMKYAEGSHTGNVIVSEIYLSGHGPIVIMKDGSFSPATLAMNGFWGWWEKISIMLPFDYTPGE